MPVDQSRQYLRIRDQLAADIAQGVLQVKLPSERELAERFLCTRITLREALQQLETEGLVYRENRRGWFVAPPRIRYNPTRTTGFMEYVSAQGRQPRTETLHAERRAAGAWLAKRMGLEDSAPVYFLQRRRWVDERPVLIELIALDLGRRLDEIGLADDLEGCAVRGAEALADLVRDDGSAFDEQDAHVALVGTGILSARAVFGEFGSGRHANSLVPAPSRACVLDRRGHGSVLKNSVFFHQSLSPIAVGPRRPDRRAPC